MIRSARLALVAVAILGAPSPARAQHANTAPRLTRPPRLTHFVDAPFPESERAAGRGATVVLRLSLGADGAVTQAEVIESAGAAFDTAAMTAARQFVFEPAEIDGRPAPIRILYRYRFELRVETPQTAVFAGTVRNREGRLGLAGVTVTLDDGAHTVTDAAGHFHFDAVSPGRHAIALAGERLTALQTEETLEAGHRLDVVYDVAPTPVSSANNGPGDDLEIVVSAPPLRREAVATAVSAEQARRVPGTQGDVLRVVENLPGVARASAGSGALVVWGSAPEDTRVFIDGVPVPRLYHDGGLRSVIASDMVQGVELVPGGYGAAYGRGLGGLVLATSRALNEPGLHETASVDLLDAGGSVRAAITDRLHVALAARTSILDRVLAGTAGPAVGSYFPIPRYYDAQARLSYALGPRETLDLTGLLSSDRLARGTLTADPSLATHETRGLFFTRAYLRYRRQLDDGSTVTITPYVGTDARDLRTSFGPTTTRLASDATLYGLRAQWRGRAFSWLAVEVGLDAEVTASSLRRNGSIADPPREGDVRVFGQPPPDQIASDQWKTTYFGIAPYVEADASFLDGALHVVPGLRVDAYARSVSRRTPLEGDVPAVGLFAQDFRAEPRLALRYAPSRRLSLHAAYGLYHQSPQPEDLSAAFGNPLLSVSQAHHFLAGGALGITDTLSLDATAFYSLSDGLAVRSPLESPLTAQALVGTGEGRAYGAQVLLRQEYWRGFFGWLSYSYIVSERRANGSAPWRPFDYDQTHVFTAVFAYDLGRGFEVGLRVRVASGYPRTDVIGAYYDARRDRYQPIFGPQNGDRLPAFFQADVRIAKRIRLGWSTLEASLEVQNVTNQSNAEEVVYNADYSHKGYITGLPLLPVLGLRWNF